MPDLNQGKYVTTRKDHKCRLCGGVIPKGSRAYAISIYKLGYNWQRSRTPLTDYYHESGTCQLRVRGQGQ